MEINNDKSFYSILRRLPNAVAIIKGDPEYSQTKGTVKFYQGKSGVLVVAEINRLPTSDGSCTNNFFGFHIHSGTECSGNIDDAFANAGTHYNPDNCPHPYHAGDMPPLLSAGGHAFLAFLTDRFSVNEILGKTVIIHSKPDDFTSQPSGNAGEKIACGVVSPVRR